MKNPKREGYYFFRQTRDAQWTVSYLYEIDGDVWLVDTLDGLQGFPADTSGEFGARVEVPND